MNIFTEDYKEKINASLLFIFLYITTLTLPFKDITDDGTAVYILTALILTISIFNNRAQINIKVLFIALFFFIIFLINYSIYPFKQETIEIFWEFIKFGLIPLYLASTIRKYDVLIKQWYIFGILNMIIWLFYLDSVNTRELSYMTLGRMMTYSFIIFTIFYYKNIRKKISFILMLISFILVAFYSNRSSLLICIVIIVFFEILSFKGKNFTLNYFKSFFYFVILLSLFLNLEGIVIFLRDTLQGFGINSYILNKTVTAIQRGIVESSSGRDFLYEQAVDMIHSNYFMPNGIGYYQFNTNFTYPHNIFLDILITFGIFGLIIFIIIVCVGIYKFLNLKDSLEKIVVFTLVIYVGIRLNFSGMFWSESILWVIIGLLLPNRNEGTSENSYQHN